MIFDVFLFAVLYRTNALLPFVKEKHNRCGPTQVAQISAAELRLDFYVGELGAREERAWNDQTEMGLKVRIYAARDRSDRRLLLREYDGKSACNIVQNEIAARTLLPASCTVKLEAQVLDLNPKDPSLIEAWVANLRCDPPSEDALFLVFEASAVNAQYAASLGFSEVSRFVFPWQQEDKLGSRRYQVRGLCRAALRSLAQIHEAGISHCSLGLGTLLLGRERILLDLFGFHKKSTLTNMKQDLRDLGIALFELHFSFMTQKQVDGNTLRKLYEDVFQLDSIAFAEYGYDFDPAWTPAISLLEENNYAGFHFFKALLSGTSGDQNSVEKSSLSLLTARGLLSSSPFFADLPLLDHDAWVLEPVRAGLEQEADKRRRNGGVTGL
mmetsp:Transcript_16/g.28  ORF Transcript_16/g.28 Transcript_16/m.28 type:complete len:383 (+) Transcript_16:58-1206(+)|eukprot:CAMPEP_0197315632 /NCGR_PEP_ID=MMETSP0891-20130614/39192_1 /TAXON_ID=44058 ORGANISM="Aureoumbra lagunensis, Strain CCMP1510" /NCGR_SAMPLE_ID=MMETSP0891 /ASSEMBLY_ACC=CAM_ASM_000534 /LENGTH=382 /DNA_ID=CAMNT_0042804719 /DNA_START=49 /DNA_END=1197 /DNA_ORIENTATION=+